MAKIQDTIDTIENGTDYVPGSLIIKSFDERGCVLKWLEKNQSNTGDRKEKFCELDATEKGKSITERTSISEITINNPQ